MGRCRAVEPVNSRPPVTANRERLWPRWIFLYVVCNVIYMEGKREFFEPFSTVINKNRQVGKELCLFTDTSFMLRSHGNSVPLLKNPWKNE